MWFCGFLDNLSDGADHRHRLRVDDAIVMIENIVAYMEDGDARTGGAARREIGFTAIAHGLVDAVFIPLLIMTGLVGRIAQEFASR
jgi:multidrug efflux pump subunit AcrB